MNKNASTFTVNKGMTNRYEKTLSFIQKHLPKEKRVLDLGISNPFSDIMKEKGYEVFNTQGEDLDLQPEVVKQYEGIGFVTALEILRASHQSHGRSLSTPVRQTDCIHSLIPLVCKGIQEQNRPLGSPFPRVRGLAIRLAA